MFDLKKKLLSKKVDLKLEIPSPDFIPYACYYDRHTILTKNGELLQVIKVTGFSYEMIGGKAIDLRNLVRQAVGEHINTTDFALWFHTVRRKKNLDFSDTFSSHYPKELHQAWSNKHYWNDKYVNELYITIIHDSEVLSISKPHELLRTLSVKSVKSYYDKYLEESLTILNKAVSGMLDVLGQYGAELLDIVETPQGIFSEHLQFFGKIIHLDESEKPLPLVNLANNLAVHRIAFGNNALEVLAKSKKYFAGIMSIKEYHELPSALLDKFLQLPQQFIITQTLDFIHSKQALSGFKYQDYILGVSGDEELKRLSGMEDILASNTGSIADYGEQQLTIMVIEDDLRRLAYSINQLMEELSALGILIVREDIFLENCYWSQLPANFKYISRKGPIDKARIGGLASLHNFPAGKRFDNHWGMAVTIFRTASGTPYFFNFHHEDNGHTIIIGPKGSGKTVVSNFFVSEAQHLNTRVFYLDHGQSAGALIQALSGTYQVLSPDLQLMTCAFNPLLLEDSQENREFLLSWFLFLLESAEESEQKVIEQAIDKIYQMPIEKRRLSLVMDCFGGPKDPMVKRFAKWVGEGEFAALFDNENDEFPATPIWGLDMLGITENKALLAPVLTYILHRIHLLLDGTPTIIVIDHAGQFFDNPLFATMLEPWLDELREKNALALFEINSRAHTDESTMLEILQKKVATHIFLPHPEADKSCKKIYDLSDEEYDKLASMKPINRHFMMKQAQESIVGELNLIGIERLLAVLTGTPKKTREIEILKAEFGNSPDKWLPEFYK